MFEPVPARANFPQLEEEILRFWKERRIFERSMEQTKGGPRYVFYEGPPTANGLPGIHHVLARAFKDLFPRYKTMRGYYCLRRGGWDTHGLPVELEVEKELGFTSKADIERYGVAEFNRRCRESVFRYVKEWETLTERIAFWIDLKNAYITLSNEYIESVWWILRQFWDRGLLYQSYKVVPYCPRCGTPLSDHEVALGYREDTEDPSVYVKFPLRDEEGTYFLVWTTTPWTLPGNAALAVHPEATYVMVEQERDGTAERLIVAEALVEKALKGEYRVVARMPGRELAGLRYRPLYTFLPLEKEAHYVVTASFVTLEEGTGIVHIAPAFGAEDMQLGREHDLPILVTVDPRGRFVDEVTPWRGMFVKDADPMIIEDLRRRGLLYFAGTYLHTYPFCWRCGTPLLYYVRASWFIETTRFKDRLVALNKTIHWYPPQIGEGRFGNWLENNVDWALSRERYWGIPLPIWECARCGHRECIGSYAELRQKVEAAGLRWPEPWDPHKPYVDEIRYRCERCGDWMQRVPEVIDVWFDSGAMPVAQWHYPFENQELFREQFPADFICEGVDQTRGWFYSLHAIATLLFDSVAFKNVISLGLVLDEKGQKMSKSRGNVVDPWEVINVHGADALRWYFYTVSPPGQERRISVNLVGDVVRTFMLTLWNTYRFFVTYARLDGFDPRTVPAPPVPERPALDRWVLAELHTLIQEVTESLENYDPTTAGRRIAAFVDDLSNWYVRRSRRRFWKNENDADKAAVYHTLYECLVTLSHLLAPFIPFTAEALYRNLVARVNPEAPESVHLSRWPEPDPARIDERLREEMRLVMRLASLGLAARNAARIRVRQPLARIAFRVRGPEEEEAVRRLADILLDELNIKSLTFIRDLTEVADPELHLRPDRLGPRLGARLPLVREALHGLPASAIIRALRRGETVAVQVDGEIVEVGPEDVEIRYRPKPGWVFVEENDYVAAVWTELTDELRKEGLAREVVRRIQELRKRADFDVADRIVTYYQADPALAEAIAAHAPYIQAETLSEQLLAMTPPPSVEAIERATIDGMTLLLGVLRVAKG